MKIKILLELSTEIDCGCEISEDDIERKLIAMMDEPIGEYMTTKDAEVKLLY